MANVSKIKIGDTSYNIQDTVSGYTTNNGTVTGITAGAGVISSTASGVITLECDLKSTTKSTLTAASRGSTSGREYCVGLDKNGDLSVNVPWTNTTYTGGTDISINSNSISLSNVGTRNTASGGSDSVPNLTYTQLASWTNIPAGTYLFQANTTWSKNAYGLRRLEFRDADGSATLNRYCWSIVSALSGNNTDTLTQQVCLLYRNTSTFAITLYGYQNSGATLTTSNTYMYYMQLL